MKKILYLQIITILLIAGITITKNNLPAYPLLAENTTTTQEDTTQDETTDSANVPKENESEYGTENIEETTYTKTFSPTEEDNNSDNLGEDVNEDNLSTDTDEDNDTNTFDNNTDQNNELSTIENPKTGITSLFIIITIFIISATILLYFKKRNEISF